MGLFGKSTPPDPRKQVREWTSKLRKEGMLLDRQIRSIQREQEKVKTSLKQTAKRGDLGACKILAKELVNSRKAIARINGGKAQLNSIQLTLNHQLANVRVAGALQKSTEVLKIMNNLVRFTEMSATMQELSREMMKAGLIEEMIEETIDEVTGIDEDEMEEQIAAEVDKVLFELTEGQMGKAPIANTDQLPALATEESSPKEVPEEEIDDMQKRLEALKT